MTPARRDVGRLAAVCVVIAVGFGCRLEEPDAPEGLLEHRLLSEGWSSYSEVFSPDRGYRVAFLPFQIVVREWGRMSETWRVVDPDVLVVSSSRRNARYRWFGAVSMFAHCREGYPRPFFVAPDSLTAQEVFELARREGIDTCSPTTIIRIAGGTVTRAQDTPGLLQMIDLSNASLTRQDRGALRDAGPIETLLLSRTGLSDTDLSYVARLPSVTNLALDGNMISDDGITYLTGLPLVGLDLSSTQVTDYGMNRLASIRTLQVLYLANTAVTSHGEAMLLRRLPNLTIRR